MIKAISLNIEALIVLRRMTFVVLVRAFFLAPDCAWAAQSLQDDAQGIAQTEGSPRPTSSWVKMIDQGSLDPALHGIRTPEGIKVELVAQEPVVVNPVGLSFDEEGNLYVLEWRKGSEDEEGSTDLTLKDGKTFRHHYHKKNSRDEYKILLDENGDGKYDRSQIVLNDLALPARALQNDSWLYLSTSGKIIRRKKNDRDGSWGGQEDLVRGLFGLPGRQASGLTTSHDGWLYITSGAGDNFGEGSDGSRVNVLRSGAVFRCRMDGSRLTEVARGFYNPYGNVAFDLLFNMFQVDDDGDDSKKQGLRLMHVLEGSDYGWCSLPSDAFQQIDPSRTSLLGEKPGKIPPMLMTGTGTPSGLMVYHGEQFPNTFQGVILCPDMQGKSVLAYQVEPDGCTFRVSEQFELMKSEDELFRPCQASIGPDGAIYIADWRSSFDGKRSLWGDEKHGRIYRLSWKGAPASPAIALKPRNSWVKMKEGGENAWWAALTLQDLEMRKLALHYLIRQGEKNRQPFIDLALARNSSLSARAMAIGGACHFYDARVEAMLRKLLNDESPDLRRLACEALGRYAAQGPISREILISLQTNIFDTHPASRRSAILAWGKITSKYEAKSAPKKSAAQTLYRLYPKEIKTPSDYALGDACIRALEFLQDSSTEILIEYLSSNDLKEKDKAVSILESMRNREAAEAIDRILKHPSIHLNSKQIRRLLQTYPRIVLDPPIDAGAAAAWLAGHADADPHTLLTCLETLGLVGGADADRISDLVLKLLDHPDGEMRMQTIRTIGQTGLLAAAKPLGIALRKSERSLEERTEMIVSLEKLHRAGLESTASSDSSKEADGLAIFDSLSAVIQDDKAGTVRGSALNLAASINFAQAVPLAEALLRDKEPAVVLAAMQLLGSDENHAPSVGRAFLDDAIGPELLPAVVDVLQKHAREERQGKNADMLFKIYKKQFVPHALIEDQNSFEEIARVQGDPTRGRDIFLDSKNTRCVLCHQMQGVGENVGPDLSKIHDTYSYSKLIALIADPSDRVAKNHELFAAALNSNRGPRAPNKSKPQVESSYYPLGKNIDRNPRSFFSSLIDEPSAAIPSDTVTYLNYQEFVDLVTFLKNKDSQEGLKTMLTQMWVVGPFERDLDLSQHFEKNADPKSEVQLPSGEKTGWQLYPVDSNGELQLKDSFPDKSVSIYALTFVHSPSERELALTLRNPKNVKIFLNGKTDSSPPRSGDPKTVRLPLLPGWNSLLFKVGNDEGDFIFKIEFPKNDGLKFSREPKG